MLHTIHEAAGKFNPTQTGAIASCGPSHRRLGAKRISAVSGMNIHRTDPIIPPVVSDNPASASGSVMSERLGLRLFRGRHRAILAKGHGRREVRTCQYDRKNETP